MTYSVPITDLSINDICTMLNETVGKNLKKLRLMNNYSQETVEIGVNLSRSTLSKIEKGVGKIDLDRLEKFAKFFKVDPVRIMSIPSGAVEYQNDTPHSEVREVDVEYRKTDVELARCQEKTSSLKKEITSLKQEISTAKSQIKDKELIIQLLSKK